MMYKFSSAQGTIEYLVILAVIVVVSLVVVGVLSNASISPTQQISSTSNRLGNTTQGGISIIDAVFDVDGNGLLFLQNNSSDVLTITGINVGGADNNYPLTQLFLGNGKVFSLGNLAQACSCSDSLGQKKACSVVVYYTTQDGLFKSSTIELSVECVSSAIAADSNTVVSTKSAALCNDSSAGGYFFSGSGTYTDPFGICDCTMLQNISQEPDANYVLLKNIECSATTSWDSGAGFSPIASYDSPFTGTLDGNNFTISGLFIDRESETDEYIGLFSVATNLAVIKNLGLVDSNISGYNYVGGIAGYLGVGNIINSYSTNGIVYGVGSDIGGIVGSSGGGSRGSDGNISSSYFSGTVNGVINVGGLVGHMYRGTISLSHASGSINGSYSGAGGLIGNFVGGVVVTDKNIFVSECYSDATVVGADNSGGLIGYAYDGFVSNSFATGSVSGNSGVGGLIGSNAGARVTNDYATGDVSGISPVGGLLGDSAGPVVNSFAAGGVAGDFYAGGLVGIIYSSITKSFATGLVSSGTNTGEIAGIKSGGTIASSYWFYNVGGPNKCYSDGNSGCTMKSDLSWFYSSANDPNASWGTWNNISGSKYCTTDGNWCVCEGSAYPWLTWENRTC